LIVKQIDKRTNLEKRQLYGHNAEKQMAYYLRREFQSDNSVFILNDLRLTMNGDVAQIDHLIIHRFGFLIVESKSVTAEIEINEHGEWIRHYSDYSKGMASPINQATRQSDFLKKFLASHEGHLLRQRLMFKTSFSDFKYDVMVAISDNGIIKRPRSLELPEVHKADQITDSTKQLIKGYSKVNKKLLSLDVNYQFADSTMKKVALFLRQSHTPSATSKPSTDKKKPTQIPSNPKQKPVMPPLKQPTSTQSCRHCQSKSIEIRYGKFGYYFKCLNCSMNTAIVLTCNHTSCKPKIRKSKLRFYSECSACKTSELYFENKSQADPS